MTTEKREELIEAADWILDRLGVQANDPRLKGCTLELQEIFWDLHDRRQEKCSETTGEGFRCTRRVSDGFEGVIRCTQHHERYISKQLGR